ncbi:MAG: PilZ domain-containing protein [Gammaproteobacteria bacterium]|nr:PilZ domain-containing protein [Gammaproteobacteria bacterium]
MTKQQERRDFFRIDDVIRLQLSAVKPGNASETGLPPALATLNQLRRLDSENAQVLRQINDKHRDIARYLTLQNEKFEMLAQLLVDQLNIDFNEVAANISGSGFKITLEQAPSEGSEWHIRVLLLPDCFSFYCRGKVSQCEAIAGNRFEVAYEFTEIDSGDQDELVKYITKKQSKQLRAQRLGD